MQSVSAIQSVESSPIGEIVNKPVESPWEKGYNNYGPWLKEKYKGHRVFKVIVDGGFTCPNRDGSKGYGGCTYCNVDSFTPSVSRNAPTVREQVMQGMERARNGNKADKFIIYFQPNTNTYAPTRII
jgi:radical SAM superfamily enzyme